MSILATGILVPSGLFFNCCPQGNEELRLASPVLPEFLSEYDAMGDEDISQLSSQNKTEFLRHLLSDIQALEQMIESGLIESGVTRIGAEQEICLVRDDLRPALTGGEILKSTDEPHFTSELALWNLEINLDPYDAGPGCLRKMNAQLMSLLQLASERAAAFNSSIVLAGILPTIRKSELTHSHMTPSPRFKVIDQILREMRGEDFSLFIEGVDEVNLRHNSILFEACNTSFQIHLQVDPHEFADKYNWAQVIAGPVLAACVNSPMLLGKELWAETRIALFRQSIETRRSGSYVTDKQPRVAFGSDWIKTSAAEIFKNDVAIYNLIIASNLAKENSLDLLAKGEIPKLKAMNLHNGTLYKWNRACYGVGNGKAHLRIENRYVPAGPTPQDEMANVAFWIGLMAAMPEKCQGQWDQYFHFQDVRCNFLKAARNGLSNEMQWFGKSLDVGNLILTELLPMAERGLEKIGVPSEEYGEFLEIIRQRVITKRTGSRWMIESLRELRKNNSINETSLMITKYMRDHCMSGRPVHTWQIPEQASLAKIPNRYSRVDSIMITSLITVREDDMLEFAETLMAWNNFHHLPVENSLGEIVGVISARDTERCDKTPADDRCVLVSDCMTSDIITVSPETSLEKAEKLMRINDFGSLPVVRDHRIIGIVTANDIRDLDRKIANETANAPD